MTMLLLGACAPTASAPALGTDLAEQRQRCTGWAKIQLYDETIDVMGRIEKEQIKNHNDNGRKAGCWK